MYDIKKINEEIGEINVALEAIASPVQAEGRSFTDAELESTDKLLAERSEKERQLETAKRMANLSKPSEVRNSISEYKPSHNSVSTEERKLAFRGLCLRELGHEITRSMDNAIQRTGLNGGGFSAGWEKRGLVSDVAGQGGNLTNSYHSQKAEKVLKYWGGIFDACTILKTGTGNVMNYPVYDDTANAPSTVVGQNVALTTTDLAFTNVAFNAYKTPTAVFPVSYELLEDSYVDIESLVVDALSDRMSRCMNTLCTNGTGTGQAQGVVTGSTLGKTAASTTTFTWQELLDAVHSVDIAYRSSPSFGIMMHDTVLNHLRKLADTTNRPLFLENLMDPNNPRFVGHKIIINNDMPSTFTTGTKLVVVGDFSKHMVRLVNDVRISALKERWADQLAVGFTAYARFDSRVLVGSAIKHLKLA